MMMMMMRFGSLAETTRFIDAGRLGLEPGRPTTRARIALIIAFPGFFFGLFNTFFLAALILPPLLSFGFNFWKERNVIEAPCPQCGQLAAGLKGQGFTQCFVCGSQLSLRGDEWRLRSKYEDGPQAGGSKYGKVDNGVIDIESDEVIDV